MDLPDSRHSVPDQGDASVLRLDRVRKTYLVGEVAVHALRGVDLDVRAGEFVTIMGASGSGKSTLLHIMGALDRPTRGSVTVRGKRMDALGRDEVARLRGRDIGFVFQAFNLYPTMTAWENVALPMMAADVSLSRRRERALDLLARVGLARRADHLPSQLSGGQKQRVAIARALANRPAFVLADEPTGNLDTKATAEVAAILRDIHAQGRTLVVVSHDPEMALMASRTVILSDGRVVDEWWPGKSGRPPALLAGLLLQQDSRNHQDDAARSEGVAGLA